MEVSSLLWSRDGLCALLVLIAIPLIHNLLMILNSIWLTPHRIRRAFESQGITCMPRRFFHGNLLELAAILKELRARPMPHISHDIIPHALPHYHQWTKKYGDKFVYWYGSEARVNLNNPEEAKEVLSTKFGDFPKSPRRPDMVGLADNGLLELEGERWVQHRRILNPAFFLEKLKAMVPTMAACTVDIMKKWDLLIAEGQEIDVHKEFKTLTGDIIAHTAFGSSFAEGKEVFEMQHQQFILAEKISRSVYIPGARFLPTAFNRHCWKVDNTVNKVLKQLIENRLKSIRDGSGDTLGTDLLGFMIAANKGQLQGNQKDLRMEIDGIIGECKTFFLAGHETTATLLTWTCLLLAINLDWQERTREEVQNACGATNLPTPDSVNHFKLVGMVLNEALRLYPPAPFLFRKPRSHTQLGKMVIPGGTMIMVPILAWHHDERYWGPDVNEFRPERFSEGVAKACKVSGAFMPFSMGPRVCIGQAFSLLEAKVVLSIILQHYRFRLSPTYQHSPIAILTLQPQFGVPLLFEKL